MSNISKTIRFEPDEVENVQRIVKDLNLKYGVNVWDFGKVVRKALREYVGKYTYINGKGG